MKRVCIAVAIIITIIMSITVIPVSAYVVSGDFAYNVKDGYAVIIGNVGDNKDLVIPSEIDGYKVIGLGPVELGRVGGSFSKDITSAIISEGVTYIGNGMFKECEELSSVSIPNSVTYIGTNAFEECTSLTTITIPESVMDFGRGAFYMCTGLTTANVYSSVVGNEMFEICSNLTTVNLSENVMGIGESAFWGCEKLHSITIPESVKLIEKDAFKYCKMLTNVTIPESVEYIGFGAFGNCESVILKNSDTVFEEEDKTEWGMYPKTPTFSSNLTTVYAFNNSQAQRYATEKKIKHVPLARVKLNGQNVKFDMPPIIENGRTLVPMRTIFETLGAKVDWHDETSTVTALADDKTITMQIGNTQMNANGRTVKLDVAPKVINDRTLVPVRAVSESLGATVEWDDATQTVIINVQ